MTKTVPSCVLVAGALAAAGCGGSTKTPERPPAGTSAATTTVSVAVNLDAAARRALRQNYRLSLYTLWNNRLPTWARQSTRGPALAGLRSSANGRRSKGIRIRVLDHRWMIVSLRLDPSYMQATAIVQSRQHVRRYSRDALPIDKAIALNERARIELRRVGDAYRFVVWNVAIIK